MLLCLFSASLLIVLGSVLHHVRVRVLTGRMTARVAGKMQSMAAEKADAEERAAELAALDRAKSHLLADVVNEMRTPLLLISAPLQNRLAGRSALDESMREELAAVLEQAGLLRRRIEQVGLLLETELGDAQPHRVRYDVLDLVRRRVEALRPLAERYDVTLDAESGLEALWFAFDPKQMEHVLQALVRRALEDASAGDRVRVGVTKRAAGAGGEDRIVLEVLDTGRPMADDLRRVLCEDGHWARHADAIRDDVGLSLALARRFVHVHGGDIQVDGETRLGTRVQVSFPLAPAAVRVDHGEADGGTMPHEALEVITLLTGDAYTKPTKTPEASDDAGADEKATTVVVVDDHSGTRGYLSFALRKYHRVIEAGNGEEALALIREHMPDLVISDIMMPVMDGQELCRAIKADPALNHIPVFLVTANVVPDVKREGLASGADDYLIKPFDLDEAILRINNMIQLRSQLRRRYSREVVIKPSDITVSSADEAFLERARQLVETHIDDGNFGVQELASELGLSPRQLQRRLRDTVDQSPVEFIRSLRLQRAAQLLEQQYGNVSEVAYSVGFTSLSYFAKCFREQFGMSPSEFKSEQAA